jgi:hypothetical protein
MAVVTVTKGWVEGNELALADQECQRSPADIWPAGQRVKPINN